MKFYQKYCIVTYTMSMPVNGAIQDSEKEHKMIFCFNKNGCVKNDLLELYLCCQEVLLNHVIYLKHNMNWFYRDKVV